MKEFFCLEMVICINMYLYNIISTKQLIFTGDSFELLQGDYDYKFQYNLPNDLPSSYEGDWGSIKYTIKVILDIPLGFDDGGEIKLHIQSPINLNLIPYLEVSPFAV